MFKDLFDSCLPPPHPGEILREDIFPRLGMSRAALARHLGVSRTRLADVMAERAPVTVDLARRLGAALGSGAHFWLGLQTSFDRWHLRQDEQVPVKPLKLPAAARKAPVRHSSTSAGRSARPVIS